MLTDAKIKKLRPRDTRYREQDVDGLSLSVWPSGAMSWIFRYQVAGKRRDMTLGKYPALSLREARAKVAELRLSLDRGENIQLTQAGDMLFGEAAEQLLQEKKRKCTDKTYKNARSRMEHFILPKFGHRSIHDIKAAEIRALIDGLESLGKQETAFRVRALFNQVFNLALDRELTENNPMGRVRVGKPESKHYPHITNRVLLGKLLRDIDGLRGEIQTVFILRLLPHVFLRSFEIRHLRYEYLDFEAALMRIPAEIMKMKRPHVVPMSQQVIRLFDDYAVFMPQEGYVFPSISKKKGASPVLSSSTMRKALARIGYSNEVLVPHGFRSTASTLLNEMGFSPVYVDRQLAHEKKNDTSAAYNHADYLQQRREMMQAWSDFLDACKSGT